MRTILFSLLACLLTQPVLSQHPSQKEMQDQMAQMKKEINQQVADLEKQIADAKIKKENPETIKGLENQLATAKKVLGVADKTSTINANRPERIEASNSIPPYKSPFIRIPLKQPVVAPTEAQAKDHLLWYKGKKLNDSMLVTTRSRVVLYSRKRNVVIVQPDEKKDSSLMKIVKNLGKSRQWTNNYVNDVSAKKNGFFDYPLVMMTMKEFDLIEREYNKLANNTISLPGHGNSIAGIMQFSPASRGPSYNFLASRTDSIPNYIQPDYQELLALMNNPPPLDFAPPPRHELDLCYCCNESYQDRYVTDKDIWSEKFTEYETTLLRHFYGIHRACALFGDDVSEIPGLEQALDKAFQLAFKRWEKKVEQLNSQYGNDVFRYEVVISSILSLDRQKILSGYSTERGRISELDFFKSKVFEKYIGQEITARNYNVIFNYALILGYERQKQLLGASDGSDWNELIDQVSKLNRFALTIDMDFELQIKGSDGEPVMTADGNLSTPQKTHVKLGRNKDCKWQFYLYDADYALRQEEISFKIPITVNGGTKKVKKEKDKWEIYTYSGPSEMLMVFPSFRISFCQGAGKDSAMMDILRYKTENLGGYDMVDNYTVDLLEYANKMFVSATNTMVNVNEFVDIASDMINISLQAIADNPTGYARLDKMQVDYKLNVMQHDLQKRVTEQTKVDNTVILFDAQNGTDDLIDSFTNTPNSEYSIELKKGLIKLRVVLDPLP